MSSHLVLFQHATHIDTCRGLPLRPPVEIEACDAMRESADGQRIGTYRQRRLTAVHELRGNTYVQILDLAPADGGPPIARPGVFWGEQDWATMPQELDDALAKPGPNVTAFPQVGDVLTVKQPWSTRDVSRGDPGRASTP